MHYLKKIFTVVLLISFITACEFLEPENLTFISETEIYNNITRIRSLVSTIYSGLPGGYTDMGDSWIASASDEAEEVNDMSGIQNMNIGNITPYSNVDDVWNKSYKSIRDAQIFLRSSDTITWKNLELASPDEYISRKNLTKQYRAEVRFLRAFFYYELIKRYGGVPIVDKVLVNDESWISEMPRQPFASCVEYIIANCDSAATDLPLSHDTGNWGRATKGAALALKAQTLLLAASELYSRTGITDPLLGYIAGDRSQRWIRAAQAAKEVIDMTNYSFHATYENIFLLRNTQSPEVIFERRLSSTNAFEKSQSPIGFFGGNTGTSPTQDLVDAFTMADGTPFDWSNPKHAADPYSGRDPRLNKIIVVNQSKFGKEKKTVESYQGGLNGKPRDRASKTGYYLRKYVDETLDLSFNQTAAKQWIYFRLSGMYLNYAEAMNEAYGPAGLGEGKLTISAVEAVNKVRTRAAVKMPALKNDFTKAQLTDAIRSEKRVELAFEGHRYWDARRWMTASKVIGGSVRGVNIRQVAGVGFSYTPFVLETRTWLDKNYYYPIPQGEVIKSGGVIVQNPGW